tara:strand:- start:17936 stop:18241 length:306 start_codon:yes stop_codon:yes gene_type:complete
MGKIRRALNYLLGISSGREEPKERMSLARIIGRKNKTYGEILDLKRNIIFLEKDGIPQKRDETYRNYMSKKEILRNLEEAYEFQRRVIDNLNSVFNPKKAY